MSSNMDGIAPFYNLGLITFKLSSSLKKKMISIFQSSDNLT